MRTKKSFIIVCIAIVSIVGGLVAQSIFGENTDNSQTYDTEEQYSYDSDEYTNENDISYNQEFEEKTLEDLFFEIEDTIDTSDIDTEASNAGFYINEYSVSPMYKIEISEDDSPELGEGSEEWYKYDADHIELTFFENDEGEMELSSKDYYMVKNHVMIEYSFGDGEIKASNFFPGYDEKGQYEEKTDFRNLKEAIKWAKKYKRNK